MNVTAPAKIDLYRLGVKVFADPGTDSPLTDFIPVFHRWIQQKTLEDLLIDVADYSHVHQGPGILLVAHEGNYGIDETGGRRGLVYYSKRPLSGDLGQRVAVVCRKALVACRLLESETGPARIKFSGAELEIFANDRLAAPNAVETQSRLRPVLDGLLGRLFGDSGYTVQQAPDSRDRFTLRVTSTGTTSVGDLLRRLPA